LEDLMKRLEKLTAENNKLRRKVKAKRTKGGSYSSEEEDSSYEEEDFKKGKNGRNNRDKLSYNSMSFNYDNERIPSVPLKVIKILDLPQENFKSLPSHYLKFLLPPMPLPSLSVHDRSIRGKNLVSFF
jgi:hypothetical protein